jgi:hypothetical protein
MLCEHGRSNGHVNRLSALRLSEVMHKTEALGNSLIQPFPGRPFVHPTDFDDP